LTNVNFKYPPLVQQANALAEKIGFPLMPEGRPVGYQGPASACIPEVGRLLMVLVASKPGGRFAEQGTGAGVGAAWMASGMSKDSCLVSVELDADRAAAARTLFREYPNVEIRTGDWHQVLEHEPPFDLVFVDAGVRPELEGNTWARLTETAKIGGLIVMDDVVPVEMLALEGEGYVDYKREFAYKNPRVLATEVRTTPTTVALILTRIN
jgi:predicted O-methyltransferase YrrM